VSIGDAANYRGSAGAQLLLDALSRSRKPDRDRRNRGGWERAATDAKTARLKALRLAKEAEEKSKTVAPSAKPRRKRLKEIEAPVLGRNRSTHGNCSQDVTRAAYCQHKEKPESDFDQSIEEWL